MKREKFKVSILIPCYNGKAYINRCYTSIQKQTYSNLEIIFYNDGSTDDSLNILKLLKEKDNRIKIIDSTNFGIGHARNELLTSANGDYMYYLDVDDWILPKTIEQLIKRSKKGKVDIVVGKAKVAYQTTKKMKYKNFIYRNKMSWFMSKENYIKKNICLAWGSIYRVDFFRGLNVAFLEGKVFEDVGLMTYIFMNAKKFRVCRKYGYCYWRHAGSISSFKTTKLKDIVDLYEQSNHLLELLHDHKLLKLNTKTDWINGVVIQILMHYRIMLKNCKLGRKTKKKIRNEQKAKIINLIYSEYKLEVKRSNSWWKYFSFLSIRRYYRKQIKALDKIK